MTTAEMTFEDFVEAVARIAHTAASDDDSRPLMLKLHVRHDQRLVATGFGVALVLGHAACGLASG